MVRKSQIDILASLVHPRDGRWRNRFVMMEGYFDESGIHDGAAVCIVAGFYGTQSAWRKFESEWNKILTDYPELTDGFHAKVFFRRVAGKRVSVYENWSDEKASKFLDRLVQCVLRNRIFPIGYGAIVADFLALPLVSRQWLTGAKFSKVDGKAKTNGCPSKPYYLPFHFSVLQSARRSNANVIDKIHFFVGLDKSFHGYAGTLYKFLLKDDRLPADLRELLGSINNPLSKDTPGIQAADLLSYRLYRGAKDKLADPNCDPSPLLLKLLRNWRAGPLQFRLMNSEIFAAMERDGREAYEKMRENV